MKKLILTFLMTIACNDAFGMQESTETDLNTQVSKVQDHSNLRKDLIKGLAAFAGAGLFGYLSYKTGSNYDIINRDAIDRIDSWIYTNITQKVLKPKNNRVHKFIADNTLPILTAIGAFQSAKYGANKIGSVISARTPVSFKQKLSSMKSKVADSMKTNLKRSFSWAANRLKSKAAATKNS